MPKEKKKQWNFKNVPPDVYEKVIKLQSAMKIAGNPRTSLEHICYQLIRKGANMKEKSNPEIEDNLV